MSKRNTVVLTAVLLTLALFGWAGWANWEYRKQAAERQLALAAQQAALVPAADGSAAAEVSPLKGKPAPAFALNDLNGKKVSLASYKGKAVLINFWATWCGPCKVETPWIVALREKYASQGFEVLGISTEGEDLKPDDKAGHAKDKAAIEKFVQEMKVSYPMLVDGDTISKPYGGLDDLPTTFYVDRKGTVIAAQVGMSTQNEMEANIKKALAE